MRIKEGASIAGIRPELVLGLIIANGITPKYGQETIVTSGTTGKHKKGSLHYVGLAVDVRIWSLTKKKLCAKELQKALGTEFDVILEIDHIHIEYQP